MPFRPGLIAFIFRYWITLSCLHHLSKELPNFEYSAYAFLREFMTHSSHQCTLLLLEGFVVHSTNEFGAHKFGLHPELHDLLLATLAVLQDVIDNLEETLPASRVWELF